MSNKLDDLYPTGFSLRAEIRNEVLEEAALLALSILEDTVQISGRTTAAHIANRIRMLKSPAPPATAGEGQPPIEIHKRGQIPVNMPMCDKCGKNFLECQCSQGQAKRYVGNQGGMHTHLAESLVHRA